MSLLSLSFREAKKNLKDGFLLYSLVTLILTFSISFFISSIGFVVNIATSQINYVTPNELSLYHLKDIRQGINLGFTEMQTSNNDIKSLIREQNIVNLAYMRLDSKTTSWDEVKKDDLRIDYTSPNFLKLLGNKPLFGQYPNPKFNELMISYDFWEAEFKKQDVLNKAIIVDNNQYSISGIMPKNFTSPVSNKYKKVLNTKANIWLPVNNPSDLFDSKVNRETLLIGRSDKSIKVLTEYFNNLTSKIKSVQSRHPLKIEVMKLKDHIFGKDYAKTKMLLLFAILLFVLSLASIVFLLSAKISKSSDQILYKKIFGAHGWQSTQTQSIEYGIMVLIVLGLSLPTIQVMQKWLSSLGMIDSLSYINFSYSIIIPFILATLALVYVIVVVIPFYKTRNKNLSQALKNNILSNNRKTVFIQKILLYIQTFFSMSLLIISIILINNSYENYDNSSNFNYKNIAVSEVKFKGDLSNMERFRQIIEIKKQLTKKYSNTSFVTASPVNLIGELTTINQPIRDSSVIQELSNQNGAITVMYNKDIQESNYMPYNLSIVYTDIEYFKLLDIKFLEGEPFKEGEDNKVVITKGAKNAIFLKNDEEFTYIDEIIPADGILKDWKVGLILSGIIDNINISAGDPISGILKNFKPVFKLLTEQTSKHVNLDKIFFLVKLQYSQSFTEDIQNFFVKYDDFLLLKRTYLLEDEVNRIVFQSSIKSISASIIAFVSIIIVLLGTWGVVDSVCARFSKETGIRLALGAERNTIYRYFMSNNILPSIYGLITSLLIFIGLNKLLNLSLLPIDLLLLTSTLLLFFIIIVSIMPVYRMLAQPISLTLHSDKK
ncbi:MAG: hypothetical protein L3J53_01210 [Proteobacteria bacterium]|nr:hypothetical protein [Pseudomonadota bacterium]